MMETGVLAGGSARGEGLFRNRMNAAYLMCFEKTYRQKRNVRKFMNVLRFSAKQGKKFVVNRIMFSLQTKYFQGKRVKLMLIVAIQYPLLQIFGDG
jgi:hypothetical protein